MFYDRVPRQYSVIIIIRSFYDADFENLMRKKEEIFCENL